MVNTNPLSSKCCLNSTETGRGLETFSTVLTCMYLYTLTVTNFGNLEVLRDLPWTIDVFVSTGIATCAMVQVCSKVYFAIVADV